MTITYIENLKTFHLENEKVSYVLAIEEEKFVVHHYWGNRLSSIHTREPLPQRSTSFLPNPEHLAHKNFSLSALPQEYPGIDIGDSREPAYSYNAPDGYRSNLLEYSDYKIYKGKKELKGLPHTYINHVSEAETLEIYLVDKSSNLNAILSYSIFSDLPVVTRSVRYLNNTTDSFQLNRVLSMSMDFYDSDYHLIQLPGHWARERDILRSPIVRGIHRIDSKHGTTAHNYQPFIGLVRSNTTEFVGEAYGFHFVYSGEFMANVEVDPFSNTRVQMGISPEHFKWDLKPGTEFQTPEVVMVYSNEGLNGMSHGFHKLYQNHLIRGKHKFSDRPVLINNWEGTYFDFNEEKIISMATEAATIGVELFVLDDGWFGKRNNDTSSLGDWFVNSKKIPNGLQKLSDKIHSMGMKFGLWFEPEMISENSELFKRHPDWYIHTPNRPKSLGRTQMVLDFSREEVRKNILEQIKKILNEVNIDYIKWDYNRNMTELIPGEIAHRYILGLYAMMEELVNLYPDILFESCSGGGGRFDPGFLYYMPQTWTSDNTDAVARLEIQTGTSMVMPLSSITAHVSAVPNHQVNRVTSLQMRGNVAMNGNLGYELDLATLTDSEKNEVKEQIKFYKNHRRLLQYGNFYRIISPFDHSKNAAWIIVDDNKESAMFTYFQIFDKANKANTRIKLFGLDSNSVYKLDDGRIFSGDELMNIGIYANNNLSGDFKSVQIYLTAI